MSRTENSKCVVRGLFALVSVAGSASAQTAWNGGGTADWYTGANWTAGVPFQTVNAMVHGLPVAIVGGGAAETLDLSITAAAAKVQVNSGATLRIYGSSLSNNGTLTVFPHDTSGFDAYLEFRAPATTLSGTGTIVLGPISPIPGQDAGIVTNVATNTVTQSAGHTIRGNGYIVASMNNAGVITADIAGRGIGFGSSPQSNSGLIVAQNGAYVHFDGGVLTQAPTGVFRATGAGSIAQAFGSIVGGTWEGVSSGIARTASTNLTLDGVTTSGDVHVVSGHHITVVNSLTNTGTITVNPTGGSFDATLFFASPAITLSGGGTIVLCPSGGGFAADAGINSSAPTNVVTNPVDATIRGNGYINANIANAGLITCDITGKGLSLVGDPKSNSGEIIAQNGGVVGSNTTITQTGSGVFRATGAGSIAQIGPGTLVGGTLEGVDGGIAQTVGNATLDAVTLNGVVNVQSGHHVTILNALTNTGTLTVNPSGGSNDATLTFASPAITLNGGGTIVLCATGGGFAADAGINSSAPTNVVTNPADATIRGNGYINANIANAGLITCDLAGKGLALVGDPKSNSGDIIAQNGGVVGTNVTITQTGSGVFGATGAGSIAQIGPGTLIGGTWEGLDGGIAQTVGNVTLDAVTLNGVVNVHSGNTANLNTSLTNNAILTVNPTGGATNATVVVLNSLTIDGAGAILFNGVGSLNDASIFGSAAVTLTNATGHTLGGNGEININLTNHGILSPGRPSPSDQTQTLSRSSDIACSPTSAVKIDIEGTAAGQFDRIVSNNNQADFVCGGTLEVSHINGFTGSPVGTTFDVITAIAPASITGEFASLVQPINQSGGRYVIEYTPQAVRLRVACYADCDGDAQASIDDFICFQTLFALGDPFADCDGDAFLSIDDFICFQTLFAIGC